MVLGWVKRIFRSKRSSSPAESKTNDDVGASARACEDESISKVAAGGCAESAERSKTADLPADNINRFSSSSLGRAHDCSTGKNASDDIFSNALPCEAAESAKVSPEGGHVGQQPLAEYYVGGEEASMGRRASDRDMMRGGSSSSSCELSIASRNMKTISGCCDLSKELLHQRSLLVEL